MNSLLTGPTAEAAVPCRFAQDFSTQQLLANATARKLFVDAVVHCKCGLLPLQPASSSPLLSLCLLTKATGCNTASSPLTTGEGQFHRDGVGYNWMSGLTYDGHGVNFTSGELAEPVHNFSAASKESVHLSLLALAVSGDERYPTLPYSPRSVVLTPGPGTMAQCALLHKRGASVLRGCQEESPDHTGTQDRQLREVQ